MDGVDGVYFQPLLFQPQPVSSVDLPVVFSTIAEDDQQLSRLPYMETDPNFALYNPCYSPSLQCNQMDLETPLQQWIHYSEEHRAPTPYHDQASYHGYAGSLSPVPPELMWTKPHHPTESTLDKSLSRTASFISNTSSWNSCPHSDLSRSDMSRSSSPNASEMAKWGQLQERGTWRCAYPGCTSRSVFRRGCDLRKHYRRHTKSLFCRHSGCKQATEGGFSSEKDRARHEAKHNPQIACEWAGCSRVFSRVDNMRDHVRRIHHRKNAQHE